MSRPPRQSAQVYEGAKLMLTLVSEPAICEMLDHLAEELAKEYVRLMKGAAFPDSCGNLKPGEEKTSSEPQYTPDTAPEISVPRA